MDARWSETPVDSRFRGNDNRALRRMVQGGAGMTAGRPPG